MKRYPQAGELWVARSGIHALVVSVDSDARYYPIVARYEDGHINCLHRDGSEFIGAFNKDDLIKLAPKRNTYGW